MKTITTFLKTCLPFFLINLLRALRGEMQLKVAFYLPYFLLSDDLKAIKARLNYKSNMIVLDSWNKAFLEYSNGVKNPINLLWADGPKPGNFGDWLSPYVFHKLTSQQIVHIPDYSNFKKKHILGIGSIANKTNKFSHVFGAGIHSINDYVNPAAKFYFVRGPHTSRKIIECGGKGIDIFGDMGFILNKIYQPFNIDKDIDVLFVRHLIHQKLDVKIPSNFVEYSICASDAHSIEKFINVLLRSRVVVTSAMHCYIVCKSYGIPCALIDFWESDLKMFGDGIKYHDAMLGAGLKPYSPFSLKLDLNKYDLDNIVNEDKLSNYFVNDLYNHVKKSILLFNND
jgi:hypothetical protein